MENMNARQRMEALAKHKGMTRRQFEVFLGLSESTIAHMYDTVSQRVVMIVATRMPEVSPLWLAYGEGRMLRSDQAMEEQKRLGLAEESEKRVRELSDEVARLRTELDDKTAQYTEEITRLRNRLEVSEMKAETYRQIIANLHIDLKQDDGQ